MEYAYTRSTNECFDTIIEALEAAVAANGFVVDDVHDLHRTLAAKGFPISPLRVYEVRAGDAFWPAAPPGLELVFPCRMSVCVEDGHTVVAAIRPSLAARVFPEARLEAVAERIEARVVKIIDSAVDAGERAT